LIGFIVPLNSTRWLHSISFVTESFLCESVNYPRIKPLNSQFSALPHSVRDSEKEEEFVENNKKKACLKLFWFQATLPVYPEIRHLIVEINYSVLLD